MTRYVVDASVAVAWYYREAHSQAAGKLLESDAELHAPHLLRIETASALVRQIAKGDFTLGEVENALARLDRTGIIWTSEDDLLVPSARIAAAEGHPIYDCLYLTLAQQKQAILATIDRQMARLASRLLPPVEVDRQFLGKT